MGFFVFPVLPAIPLILAFQSGQVQQSIAWQAQFAGAVSWTTYGVVADSGTTDNTAALNSLPANTPIIADCPGGGYVSYSGSWSWPSGLTVWQQPGCLLESTDTTVGIYPIQNAGGTAVGSCVSNVQYYGMQFSFVVPTDTVRMMLACINHFKFLNFDVNGSGGFALLAGSDQEIGYGTVRNTLTGVGDTGLRLYGNIPKVATSRGMHANVWVHNVNIQSGDGSLQSCQPNGNNPAFWGYDLSTDDVLYEDVAGNSASSGAILVNEAVTFPPGVTYSCSNIVYRNVYAGGLWFASIFAGGAAGSTHNVTIDTAAYDGTGSVENLAAIGIGNINYGGENDTGTNISDVTLNKVTVKNAYKQSLNIVGHNMLGMVVTNSSFGAPQLTNPPNVTETGTKGLVFSYNNITSFARTGAEFGAGAIQTVNPNILNNTVTNVYNGYDGFLLSNVSGGSLKGAVVTPHAGQTTSQGIALTPNPNGTNNMVVTGNDVSAMPTGVVCASGQGNVVTGNAGASDCPP